MSMRQRGDWRCQERSWAAPRYLYCARRLALGMPTADLQTQTESRWGLQNFQKHVAGKLLRMTAWVLGSVVVAHAGVQAASSAAASVQDIRVLQSIPAGQWELTSRTESASGPAGEPEAPELGCLSAKVVSRDLQELIEQVQAGQRCTVVLPSNTDVLGRLELRCQLGGKAELPVVMEFRRPAQDQVHVVSQLQMGGQSMRLVQDYQWKGACPQ